MIYNLRICEGSTLTYWKMVVKYQSSLGVFPPKMIFVNWVLCKAIGQQWQAGSLSPSSRHSGEVPTANDLDSKWYLWGAMWSPQNTADVVLQQLLPGAEQVPRGGHRVPRVRLTLALCVMRGFSACCSAHTEERGDTTYTWTCCAACLQCKLSAASSTSVQ